MLDFIFRQASPASGELILEIGPGFGALTEKLVASGARIVSIELDKRLAEYIEKNVKAENFSLRTGDACRLDIDALVREFRISTEEAPSWRCIANLPYSISTPFIAKVLKLEHPPKEMFFMLQKETAERFVARPRTKEYGSISVLVQAMFSIEILRTVPPQVFFPPPRVESALARFTIKPPESRKDVNIRELSEMVRIAFSRRRKKMCNNLAPKYTEDSIREAISAIGASSNTRAEELEIEEFSNMLRHLVKK